MTTLVESDQHQLEFGKGQACGARKLMSLGSNVWSSWPCVSLPGQSWVISIWGGRSFVSQGGKMPICSPRFVLYVVNEGKT